MECRLSCSTGSWSCQIFIRREYDSDGNVLDKVVETPFGHVITDKKNVELALRRAQVAVLNPHLQFKDILKASAEDLTGPHFDSSRSLKFSRDTICIDLEGPELTDLDFVDLPGLIQNAEPSTVKLVEDMVVSHIKGNCLILVALPMTDDIENQMALRLARQEDPDGKRTIGVMTKPDMLTAGSTKAREMWLDIIEGRRHPLAHGYYCTRQPDDAERAKEITSNEARAIEAAFFSTTTPWSKSTVKNRFGTGHLVASLSQLLIGIINETLPRITGEAASKLEACNQELASLPEEITEDPANYMLKLITGFCDNITRSVESGLDSQLVHLNRDTYAEFKVAIRKSAPNFVPAVQPKNVVSGNSSIVDEYSEEKPFYLSDMREHIKRSITRELPNNVPFSAKVDLITKFQAGWEAATQVCFNAVRGHVKQMLKHQVARTFHRYEKLEGHIRISVEEIVESRFDSCNLSLGPVLSVEATPYTQNGHYLSDSTAKWLAIFKEERASKGSNGQPPHKKRRTNNEEKAPTPAPATVVAPAPAPAPKPSAFSFAKDTTQEASATPAFRMPVAEGFGAVSQGMFGAPTQSPQAFGASSSAFGAPSQAPTLAQKFSIPPPTTATNPIQVVDDGREKNINDALAALAALGYRGITEADFGKLIPPDEYETEIQVMAEVRGYFQIAYKRVIDYIPSLIDLLFVKAIAQNMQDFLITKLSLGTADAKERCAAYLAENLTVVARRKELTIRKERLDEVKQALQAFGLS
ncbi:hypothetical protein DXG01_014095 [Tephrocybe rancida]|nr:hypothetical protein DXG01_014095 [Tephrocybe rancida]